MQLKLLKIIVCPKCHNELTCVARKTEADGDIIEGTLDCAACDKSYKIISGIPRFVELDNYANSFGMQWNLFKSEQLDSQNGFQLSEKRFFDETGWNREWMARKLILDAGCGAGRFLDIASQTEAEVIGIDLSNAIDASQKNMEGRKNVHLIQASIYELPFLHGTFDGVYCIGVVQHTPDPEKTLSSLAKMVKANGMIAFFIYERKRWTMLYSKYLIRPFTKRLSDKGLLRLIKASMPVLFPLTEVTFRIPVLSRLFRFIIPVSNYVGINARTNTGLTIRQRYQWALMDTFDMLAPEYDEPKTMEEVREVLTKAGIKDIRRTTNYGLCLNGRKTTEGETN